MAFIYDGTSNLTVGGKIGIGTTQAANTLTVQGAVSIGTYSSQIAPANSLIVSGNVGIGTTLPVTKLHVNGSLMGMFQIAYIYDEKSQGTNGGACSTSWQTRTLNAIASDTIGVTLSSNVFTIPAGTYDVLASAPAYYCQRHRTRLVHSDTTSVIAYGTSEYSNGNYAQTRSIIDTRFTIYGTSNFKIEHYTAATNATNGFGVETNATNAKEVYTTVRLTKIA